jgi:hypothetical protein
LASFKDGFMVGRIMTIIIGNPLLLLFFFGGQRKVAKETRPLRCGKLPDPMVSVAWAKTRFVRWAVGIFSLNNDYRN